METLVIVKMFTNLDDKDILLEDAIDFAKAVGRVYERINKEAKEKNMLLVGPFNRCIVLGERQHVYVEAVCYDLIEKPVLAPPITMPGRA